MITLTMWFEKRARRKAERERAALKKADSEKAEALKIMIEHNTKIRASLIKAGFIPLKHTCGNDADTKWNFYAVAPDQKTVLVKFNRSGGITIKKI